MRYAACTSECDAKEWLGGGDIDGAARWHTPDPFMNFSISGLCFEDHAHCRCGDKLLVEIAFPGQSRKWRATAEVVGLSPIPEDERLAFGDDEAKTHRIAVEFVALPPELLDAVLERTNELQSVQI